jgi:hypothetical protein
MGCKGRGRFSVPEIEEDLLILRTVGTRGDHMKLFSLILSFALTLGIAGLWNCPVDAFQDAPGKDITILKQWNGDYPVAKLNLLPENQRQSPTGFLDHAEVFVPVWQVFKPNDAMPDVDFEQNLVVFHRNTEYYNSTNIFKVQLSDGIAQVMAMETLSATPVEDKVAMAMAVIPRAGITAILAGEEKLAVPTQIEAKKKPAATP